MVRKAGLFCPWLTCTVNRVDLARNGSGLGENSPQKFDIEPENQCLEHSFLSGILPMFQKTHVSFRGAQITPQPCARSSWEMKNTTSTEMRTLTYAASVCLSTPKQPV